MKSEEATAKAEQLVEEAIRIISEKGTLPFNEVVSELLALVLTQDPATLQAIRQLNLQQLQRRLLTVMMLQTQKGGKKGKEIVENIGHDLDALKRFKETLVK